LVVIEVMLDEEGKVLGAKALSGPVSLRSISESAARNSKFKPVVVGSKAVQAVGYINYNFTQ
jgi:protein TonB